MRKVGFLQSHLGTKEILPKTYKVEEVVSQRKMFCTLINEYLSKQSQFNLQNTEIFEHSLLAIFEQKILSFFQINALKVEKSQPITKLFLQESKLINQYFKQSQNPKMKYLSRHIHFTPHFNLLVGYQHPVCELISLIFNGKEIEMMLDLNEMFTKTVFRRIRREKGKKVTLDSPYIHIDQHGVKTRLYPQWKKIYANSLEHRSDDIENGFKQLHNEEVDRCFLVYPKSDNFTKHITLQHGTTHKQLKMVPYSFTFCTREKKQCKK